MLSANLLILPIFIPLAGVIAGLLTRRRLDLQFKFSVFFAALHVLGAAAVAVLVWPAPIALHVGGWQAPLGIVLVGDRLAASLLTVSALVHLAVSLYSIAEVPLRVHGRGFHPLLHLLQMGVCGAFMTGDLFNLYVWFEVLLIASFVLLGLAGNRERTRGAFIYVMLNLTGSACFLIGIGFIYGMTGTLTMADLSMIVEQARAEGKGAPLDLASILLLVAFSLKAGLIPLMAWLPASYHLPSPALSAIFAGLLTKVGVYALMRTFTLIFPPGDGVVHDIIMGLALITMVGGVLGAVAQNEIRRILSWHIISQVGYMVLALALGSPIALAAGVFYLVHHIVVKANLFLVGGLAAREGGGEKLANLGGLAKRHPGLAVLFAIPALSLAGLPPLSGFLAKLAVVQAGLVHEDWIAVVIALAVGLLTAYSMLKIWVEVFAKPAPESMAERPSRRTPWSSWVPCAVLAGVTVLVGVLAGPLALWCEGAATTLIDPVHYRQAVFPDGPPVIPTALIDAPTVQGEAWP